MLLGSSPSTEQLAKCHSILLCLIFCSYNKIAAKMAKRVSLWVARDNPLPPNISKDQFLSLNPSVRCLYQTKQLLPMGLQHIHYTDRYAVRSVDGSDNSDVESENEVCDYKQNDNKHVIIPFSALKNHIAEFSVLSLCLEQHHFSVFCQL